MDLITVTYNERPFAVVRIGHGAAEAIRRARALVAARWHGASFGEEPFFDTRAATRYERAGWLERGEDYLLVGERAATVAAGLTTAC